MSYRTQLCPVGEEARHRCLPLYDSGCFPSCGCMCICHRQRSLLVVQWCRGHRIGNILPWVWRRMLPHQCVLLPQLRSPLHLELQLRCPTGSHRSRRGRRRMFRQHRPPTWGMIRSAANTTSWSEYETAMWIGLVDAILPRALGVLPRWPKAVCMTLSFAWLDLSSLMNVREDFRTDAGDGTGLGARLSGGAKSTGSSGVGIAICGGEGAWSLAAMGGARSTPCVMKGACRHR